MAVAALLPTTGTRTRWRRCALAREHMRVELDKRGAVSHRHQSDRRVTLAAAPAQRLIHLCGIAATACDDVAACVTAAAVKCDVLFSSYSIEYCIQNQSTGSAAFLPTSY